MPTGSGVLSAAIWALYQYPYPYHYLNNDKGKNYIDMADTAIGAADRALDVIRQQEKTASGSRCYASPI